VPAASPYARWWTVLRLATFAILTFALFFWRGADASSSEEIFLALIAVAGVTVIADRQTRPASPRLFLRAVWPYVAYFVAVVLLWMRHPDAAATGELYRQTAFLVLAGVTVTMCRTVPAPAWLAAWIVCLGLIVVQILGPRSVIDHLGRASHYPFAHQWSGYPELGLLATLGAAACIALVFASSGRALRGAAAVLAVGFAGATMFMVSRSAVLAVGVCAGWLLLASAARLRSRLALVLLVPVAAATIWMIANGQVVERVERVMDTSARETGIRAEGWRTAMAMVRDRPLTGVGLGGYAETYAQYSPRQDSTHAYNLVLHLAAELGLPGLALYLLLWARVLWTSLRASARTWLGTGAFVTHAMLVAFFVRSQSEHFLANLDTSARLLFLLAMLFGFAEAARRASAVAATDSASADR